MGTDRTYGTHMAYTWHTYGIHMEYTWHAWGTHMSYTWHANGIHMSYTWHTHGQVKYTWPHGKHMSNTCQSTCQTHAKHMSNTCHTHFIHMEYTLYSVMLCHALSFSVMDVVGHWDCNSPGDCKFIVMQVYICPGFYGALPKKHCSHSYSANYTCRCSIGWKM